MIHKCLGKNFWKLSFFLLLWYAHVISGVRNVSFSENRYCSSVSLSILVDKDLVEKELVDKNLVGEDLELCYSMLGIIHLVPVQSVPIN